MKGMTEMDLASGEIVALRDENADLRAQVAELKAATSAAVGVS